MNTIVVSLFVILTVVSLVSMAPTKNDLRLHNKIVKNFKSFKCRDPQPRAVSVSEILGNKMESDKTYIPSMTVLHRCKDSGCCQPGLTCRAKDIEAVQLVIKAEKTIAHGKTVSSYVTVTAQNHTSCHCSDPDSTPK